MGRLWIGAVLVAGLAGCVVTPEPPVGPLPPEPAPDACGASGAQGLVGLDESVLATMKFRQPVRVLRPGMAVTMDYSAERLNIEVDAAGRIIRVSCG